MKIATLTLHLPFNYGNALQMFSLHRYLLEQGYDAEVLSHWFCDRQDEIWYWHNCIHDSIKQKCRFLILCCTWTGVFCQFWRETKFKKWHDSMLRWSSETGENCVFPASKLQHDIIIVGSDQVWNPKYEVANFFLLPDFPDRITKIAYAASLGSDAFPKGKRDFFARQLERFKAVSVRESSAVEILKKECGCDATLVADPTLLHSREEWCSLLGVSLPSHEFGGYMVYLVTPDGIDHWKQLRKLALSTGKKLHVYTFTSTRMPLNFRKPLETTVSTLVKRILLYLAGVRLHFTATPSEFVQRLANCEGIFTDSFHGMMFATIFGKKCNVIVGEHEERQQMSARLRNFTTDFGIPEILTSYFTPSAMHRLSITPKLEKLIDFSKKWLKDAIEGDNCGRGAYIEKKFTK